MKVGTEVVTKGRFHGTFGTIVADYTKHGRPDYRQVMFRGPSRMSVTMQVNELEERKQMTLDQIIAEEAATHYAFVGSPDMVNLYRTSKDGQAESLQLARVGAGLRDHRNPRVAAAFEERDDWFRIATEQWEPISEIPVNSPLWPAKPV